jgi:hypothetical protein
LSLRKKRERGQEEGTSKHLSRVEYFGMAIIPGIVA